MYREPPSPTTFSIRNDLLDLDLVEDLQTPGSLPPRDSSCTLALRVSRNAGAPSCRAVAFPRRRLDGPGIKSENLSRTRRPSESRLPQAPSESTPRRSRGGGADVAEEPATTRHDNRGCGGRVETAQAALGLRGLLADGPTRQRAGRWRP